MTGAATELTVDFEFDRACDSPYVRARRERANSERRRVRVLLVAGTIRNAPGTAVTNVAAARFIQIGRKSSDREFAPARPRAR